MRVAAVQFKAHKGDRAGSLARLATLVERAGSWKPDLVVLPEMAATGYLFDGPDAARVVAEEAEGPTLSALAPLAAAHGCWLVVGFPEVDGEQLFNSALVVDPHGELRFVYRKTLLYEADLPWAEPGDSGYARFETDHGAFGVGICMDLNDDRFVDWCASSELRVVALPTNWLYEGYRVWPYWAWRMRGLQAALVAANSWGPEEQLVFSGRSAVLHGSQVLAAAPFTGDAVIRAELE